jgi:hypothetical protein
MTNNPPQILHSIGEVLDRIEARQVEAAETFKGNAHDLLVATYQGRYRPTSVQLRAAIAALPFESPKLAVTALIDDQDFGARLERAIARSGVQPKLLDLTPSCNE